MNSSENKLILGTVQFGLPYGINNQSGQPSPEQVYEILDSARTAGIQSLDTASGYGTSQKLIGTYLAKNPGAFKIFTKFAEHPSNELSQSLAELNTPHADLFSFHKFELIKDRKIQSELLNLKDQGKIKRIGVSVYAPTEIEEAARLDFIDVIQTPFNLFDNWNLRGKPIQIAKAKGKQIHVRSVYLQGLFYCDPTTLRPSLYDLKIPLQNIRQIAQEEKISFADLALQYVLQFKEIDGIILGVDSKKQLEENLRALNSRFSSVEKIHQIKIANDLALDPRTWK